MFKGRNVTPAVFPTPPFVDSQPIPSVWLDNEVQLAEKGPSNLTAALTGLILMGQEELTWFPKST